MQLLLKHAGYYVIPAQDGQSGLLKAQQENPDIILLDIMMPNMDGLTVCRYLKSQEETRDIPVIFMTALSDIDTKVQGLALGAVDYITKPIQISELQARITTHITTRKLRDGLQNEIQEREKLISELDAYAHTVAHDLKGTLNNIIGYAQILALNFARLSEADIQRSLSVIIQSGYKMRDVIDALLLLGSVREEAVPLGPINMAEIVLAAQTRLATEIDQYAAVIQSPTEWPTVIGYAPWIEEVWFNYLSNALKYGGSPPVVLLGTALWADGAAQFWIQDNGRGLTPAQQGRLFQPFTRLNQIDTKGQGLGLSIVHRIIDRLGGQVGIECEPQQGARFYFTLPLVEKGA